MTHALTTDNPNTPSSADPRHSPIAVPVLSLQDFLNYQDDTDFCYELENGKLLFMPTESECNRRIAMFLLLYFAKLGIPFTCLTMKTEVVVSGARATVRVPDVMVLPEELAIGLQGASRSIITLDLPAPQLVVEVVSPGKQNEDRDYRYKRSQYQARGIREYWIVDPIQNQISVLSLVEGLYEEPVFMGEEAVISTLLQAWGQESPLTVAAILQAGMKSS